MYHTYPPRGRTPRADGMGCGASKPPARQAPFLPGPVPDVPDAAEEPQEPIPLEPEAAPSILAPAATVSAAPEPAANVSAAPAPDTSWDDWDDEDDDAPTRSQPPNTASTEAAPQPTQHAAFRNGAGVLCIGAGDAMQVGLCCTSCGQRVHRFCAHRWDESVDYYTCRNFSPDDRMPHKQQEDLAKLARWLRPAADGAAYACGCSWQSVGLESKPLEGDEGVLAAPHGGARLGEAKPCLKWVAI